MRLAVGAGCLLLPALFGCNGRDALLARMHAEIDQHLAYFERRATALAERIPPVHFGWRPATGVRSVAEAFLHIAATNWIVARMAGDAAPGDVDVGRLEQATGERTRIVELLRRSFGHLRAALAKARPAGLEREVDFHGKQIPLREVLLKQAMHASEHLGQLVAYARSVGVGRAAR